VTVARWRRQAALLLGLSLLVSLASGACAQRATPGPQPGRAPTVRQAELWYATAPAAGVWAELMVVLDNPQSLEADRTVLRFPGALLDDFALRDTEPALLAPPVREPDGSYSFVFPPPLDRSLNWYRVFLAARRAAPRPFRVAVAIERPGGGSAARLEVPPVAPRTRYVDREADPFRVVPEGAVAWIPTRPGAILPLLALTAAVLAVTAAGGCLAAFRLQRR
jgi:hypothetical protein